MTAIISTNYGQFYNRTWKFNGSEANQETNSFVSSGSKSSADAELSYLAGKFDGYCFYPVNFTAGMRYGSS